MANWTRSLAAGFVGLLAVAMAFLTARGVMTGDRQAVIASLVIGVTASGAAGWLAWGVVRRVRAVRRDVERGFAQIEAVLRLEAAMFERRQPATGAPTSCPRCGESPSGCSCPQL
jgi:hypothetical protein